MAHRQHGGKHSHDIETLPPVTHNTPFHQEQHSSFAVNFGGLVLLAPMSRDNWLVVVRRSPLRVRTAIRQKNSARIVTCAPPALAWAC
jgi:hypothetical protein